MNKHDKIASEKGCISLRPPYSHIGFGITHVRFYCLFGYEDLCLEKALACKVITVLAFT